jgi:hypothetical protein
MRSDVHVPLFLTFKIAVEINAHLSLLDLATPAQSLFFPIFSSVAVATYTSINLPDCRVEFLEKVSGNVEHRLRVIGNI